MSGPGVLGPSCPLSLVDNVVPRARLQIPALPKGTQVYFTSHRRAGLSLLVYSLLFEAEAQGTLVPILRRLGVLGMLSCLLTLTVTHGSAPMGHGHCLTGICNSYSGPRVQRKQWLYPERTFSNEA